MSTSHLLELKGMLPPNCQYIFGSPAYSPIDHHNCQSLSPVTLSTVVAFRIETVSSPSTQHKEHTKYLLNQFVHRKYITSFIKYDPGIFITELIIKCFLSKHFGNLSTRLAKKYQWAEAKIIKITGTLTGST